MLIYNLDVFSSRVWNILEKNLLLVKDTVVWRFEKMGTRLLYVLLSMCYTIQQSCFSSVLL